MDDRIVNKKTDNRSDRGDNRATPETLMVSSEERRKMFREFTSEALPTPPACPGWHYLWLSTTNQYDPIHKRLRMGYELVKADEIPGFKSYKVGAGEFEGFISVNEMILAKIPEDVYYDIMSYLHHEKPLEEEDRLRTNAIEHLQDSNGRPLGEKLGEFASGRASVGKPVFN